MQRNFDTSAMGSHPAFAVSASNFRDHNSPAAEAAQDALIFEMSTAKQRRKPKAASTEKFAVAKDPDARFHQALEIQERQNAGDPVGEREASWLDGYQTHPEFEARIELHKSFGGNDAG
ncbi:hypothetical protein [Pseudophaeobacter sp.]|uniref:hypothetical protein n=1 Tax=Pseudophaeobacter sp. TaxID=1971739 RepID=UPI003296A271